MVALKGIPGVQGQWHECLTEAVREGCGGQAEGPALAGAPQTGRVAGQYPTFRELSAPRIGRNGFSYTRKEGSFSGKTRGSLMLLPLR